MWYNVTSEREEENPTTSEREKKMKVYIIMRRPVDLEGKYCGPAEIYKIFIKKETAEKFVKEMKDAWDKYYMEEKEAE